MAYGPSTDDDEFPRYPSVPVGSAKDPMSVSRAFDRVMAGHLNIVGQFEFAESPQTVNDPRISPWSCVLLAPMVVGPTPVVTSYAQESFVVEWTGSLSGTCRYLGMG